MEHGETFDREPAQALRPVVPELTGAQCINDLLTVDIPLRLRHGFSDALTLFGSYHVVNYNLFYLNIRTNAQARAEAFLTRAGARRHGPANAE